MRKRSRDYGAIRSRLQTEAGAWGMLTSLHNAFINPLLVSRGAGAMALGVFNSGANLFGLGSAYLGPRLAARAQSVPRVALGALLAARIAFFGVPILLLVTHGGSVALLIAVVLLWTAGEGIASPLWTSFLAGLVGPSERGRWLALRATIAAAAAAVALLLTMALLRLVSSERSLQVAYTLAAVGGLTSLWQLRSLFRAAPPPPVPPARSARQLPPGRPARRFLGGVFFSWFGAGLVWPVLPPYIIHHLHAPTTYFAAVSVVSALTSMLVQRVWGRIGDARGARATLSLAGIGVGAVPLLWAMVPVYWLGIGAEVVASSCWPGHLLGLTLRAMELAPEEAERPEFLAWTNLAQGSGASLSPLVASLLVGHVGTIPLLIAAGLIRFGGAAIIGEPVRSLLQRPSGGEEPAREAPSPTS